MLPNDDDSPWPFGVQLDNTHERGALGIIQPQDPVGGVAHMLEQIVYVDALPVRPEEQTRQPDIAGERLPHGAAQICRCALLRVQVLRPRVDMTVASEPRPGFRPRRTWNRDHVLGVGGLSEPER
nr:hypothetical protein [Mycolicibacterium thermoresistibile]